MYGRLATCIRWRPQLWRWQQGPLVVLWAANYRVSQTHKTTETIENIIERFSPRAHTNFNSSDENPTVDINTWQYTLPFDVKESTSRLSWLTFQQHAPIFPSKYLGLPLSLPRVQRVNFQPLVENPATCWKSIPLNPSVLKLSLAKECYSSRCLLRVSVWSS
jgi:hypothetical protein